MIYRVERLLEEWAKCTRLEPVDAAGLGYPKGMGAMVLTRPSRARRVYRGDKVVAGVLRHSIGGGLTASGVASRPSKAARRNMSVEVERLDAAVHQLPVADQRLLEVYYTQPLPVPEKAGLLRLSVSTLTRRLGQLHVALDRAVWREQYVGRDLASNDAALDVVLDNIG